MKTVYDVGSEHLKIVLDDVLRRSKALHEEMVRRIEDGDLTPEAKANYGGAIVGMAKLYMEYKAILEEITGAPSGPAAKEVENFLNDILIEMHLRGYNIREEDTTASRKGDGSDEPTRENLDEGGKGATH